MNGADLLVRGLERAGVSVAFGLPGVHNLPLWAALANSDIRLVGVRHEQTAAYAADGYARATGRLGVAVTTTGPGAANTLGAVGEAWASGSPILVIATDIPTTVRRRGVYRGALHETTDQAGMFSPVTKAMVQAAPTDDLGWLAWTAAETALAAPTRPVYLEIPTDLLSAEFVSSWPPPHDPPEQNAGAADEAAEDRAAEILAGAQRPLIWAGGGALRSGAGSAVGALAERLGAPVLTTYQARGLLSPDHPCDVGLPPHIPEAGALWDAADVVVAIGSDLDGMMTQNWAMPQPPTLIAINVDGADATKNYQADLVLVGDAAEVASALAVRLAAVDDLDRLAGDSQWLRLTLDRADAIAGLRSDFLDEMRFLDVLDHALPPETVIVADMCIPGYWVAGFRRFAGPRQLAYPVGWGTLGFAFPASLGSALAGTGPVVSISGDGGFLFACGELATVAQEQIPLTSVIVDDGGYGMLRYDQRRAGDSPFGVDLDTPDFAALSESFGVRSETVEGLGDDFGGALKRHVAMAEPTVLVASAALQPPPTTSPRWYRHGG
ncbi:MAG TPA: thiamine pyrophosphate-binding protein [Egibacteraceae bacterium]|nr:thiamine pyrophosphate-binding protein [Egibacteraceae bacterium]